MATPRNMKKSLRDRFEEKYIPEPNSGCWLWTASFSKTGERHHSCKLTWADVDEIRSSALGCRRLAKAFNVASATINKIRNNMVWKEEYRNA